MNPVQCLGVLGLQPNYTMDDLRQAYRRKALLTHPDKHAGREAQFLRVQEAYETLAAKPTIDSVDARAPALAAWQWNLLSEGLSALGCPDSPIWQYAHEHLGASKASMLERLVREASASIGAHRPADERAIELTCELGQGLRGEYYPLVVEEELHYVPLGRPTTALRGKSGVAFRTQVRWRCPDGIVVEYPNILYDSNVFDKAPFATAFPDGRCQPMKKKSTEATPTCWQGK